MNGIFAPLPVHYPSLDAGLADIERVLNWVGYCPVVLNAVSGVMRQFFGAAQLIAAVAYVAYNIFRMLMADAEQFQSLLSESVSVLHYAWHGIFNIVRGQIETIPFVNWSFILIDRIGKIRIFYPAEPVPDGYRPVFV